MRAHNTISPLHNYSNSIVANTNLTIDTFTTEVFDEILNVYYCELQKTPSKYILPTDAKEIQSILQDKGIIELRLKGKQKNIDTICIENICSPLTGKYNVGVYFQPDYSAPIKNNSFDEIKYRKELIDEFTERVQSFFGKPKELESKQQKYYSLN